MHIDQEKAIKRALELYTTSALDAAFLAVIEQIYPEQKLTLTKAASLLNNDQILDYAAFLYESRTRSDLHRDCRQIPPSAESEREWLLSEDDACMARAIAGVAMEVDNSQ